GADQARGIEDPTAGGGRGADGGELAPHRDRSAGEQPLSEGRQPAADRLGTGGGVGALEEGGVVTDGAGEQGERPAAESQSVVSAGGEGGDLGQQCGAGDGGHSLGRSDCPLIGCDNGR